MFPAAQYTSARNAGSLDPPQTLHTAAGNTVTVYYVHVVSPYSYLNSDADFELKSPPLSWH